MLFVVQAMNGRWRCLGFPRLLPRKEPSLTATKYNTKIHNPTAAMERKISLTTSLSVRGIITQRSAGQNQCFWSEQNPLQNHLNIESKFSIISHPSRLPDFRCSTNVISVNRFALHWCIWSVRFGLFRQATGWVLDLWRANDWMKSSTAESSSMTQHIKTIERTRPESYVTQRHVIQHCAATGKIDESENENKNMVERKIRFQIK